MKIAIDYKHGVSNFKTGIAWYTYNLVHNIAEIDVENSYLLYDFKSHGFRTALEQFKKLAPEQENFKIRIARIHSMIGRACCRKFLPVELFTGPADIVHVPHTEAPITVRAKLVITVHDIIPLLQKSEEWSSPHRNGRMTRQFTQAVLRADRIITVSEYTKSDIVRYFSIDPSKITVAHLGTEDIFKPCEDREEQRRVLAGYGISGKYLFFAGMLSKRKNLLRLLSVYERILKHVGEYRFVFVGRRATNPEFFKKIESMPENVRNRIILTEYVPLEDLPHLYGGASVCTYLSLYEGFGLPILEAMACGCPVVTSNISSMPEVAGDAAILVDPYNTDAISDAVEKILTDRRLSADMREKGLARVKQFSWKKTARKTIQTYMETYGET